MWLHCYNEVKSLSLVSLDVLSPETTVKEKFALLTMNLGATYDLHHFLEGMSWKWGTSHCQVW